MTAGPSIDPAQFLTEQLDQASPDLMRDLLITFVNALLSAQADAVCGAGYGERTPERVNSRNGYRHRDLDTRVGTLDVAVPKLRQGSLYPDWLLERRKRAGSGRSRRWWRPATCSACPRGGWTSWCRPSASPACRSRRSR
jgi:putative transposase